MKFHNPPPEPLRRDIRRLAVNLDVSEDRRPELEEELANLLGVEAGQVVLASSGTVALQLLLRRYRDRRVTVPGYGFVATANAVMDRNRLCLADVDPSTGWALPDEEAERFAPVAFSGNVAPLRGFLDGLSPDCEVVLDAAAVLGNEDPRGLLDDRRVLGFAVSFSHSKLVSASMGGAAVFRSREETQPVRRFISQGGDWSDPEGVGIQERGTNLRMGAINAALALSHLDFRDTLVELANASRAEYEAALSSHLVPSAPGAYNIARVPNARRVAKLLQRRGVEARFRLHRALRDHAAYVLELEGEGRPRSNMWGTTVAQTSYLYLPYGPGLSPEEARTVAEALLEYLPPSPELEPAP